MSTKPISVKEFYDELHRDPEYLAIYFQEKFRLDLMTRIKQIRKAKKLSQKELAEKMGVTQAYIAGLENGKRNPTLKTLQQFCIAIGGSLQIIY